MAKKSKKQKPKDKLEDLNYANGKKETSDLDKIKELESLLHMSGNNPYKTVNKEIFLERLTRMDLDEKRQLAIRVGVVPVNRSAEMDKRLIDNFEDYIRRHQLLVGGFSKADVAPDSGAYDSIKHLLEG
jgi:hypothetical protein